MTAKTNENSNLPIETDNRLHPERHSQHDLFICDVADAVLKDDLASMEHPFYSLSKKPDLKPRRYENNGKWLEVVPSVKGTATIYDKDILIFCISQMIAATNSGKELSPHVKISAKELLLFTNRNTGGKDYEALREALERLDGTRIRTNVKTGQIEEDSGFGLIDSYSIKRSEKTGRILDLQVKLSDWTFRSVASKEVLTLNRDYFRLKKPMERRLYEIARKHCGKQAQWKISLVSLKNKCGSMGSIDKFRFFVKDIAKGNHLPDYSMKFVPEDDSVHFYSRSAFIDNCAPPLPQDDRPKLKPETFDAAREVAPNYDVFQLEKQWLAMWYDTGKPELKDPDKAFLAFAEYRSQKNPKFE